MTRRTQDNCAPDAANLSQCMACGVRFSVGALAADVLLTMVKGAVGWLCGSHALLGAALYSLNNVLSDAAVALSLKVSRRPADAKYPYGYAKVEFLAMAAVSVVLLVGVLLVVTLSTRHVPSGHTHLRQWLALGVAALSLGVNELLASKGRCAAEKLSSPALLANAEHSRADSLSSLAVFVAVGGTMLGVPFLDRLVGGFEAVHVIALSVILLARSASGLMDKALPGADLDFVRLICSHVDGVINVASIRSRRSAGNAWVDIAITVAGDRSVREAHEVAARAARAAADALGPSVHTQARFMREPIAPAEPRDRSESAHDFRVRQDERPIAPTVVSMVQGHG